MEEDLKVLEEMFFDDDYFEPIGYIETRFTKEQQQAIKNLITRNKELEEENEKIRKSNKTLFELAQHTAMQEFINEDYIPKSKVREKIEENKWAVEHYDCDEADYKQSQAVGAWNVLYHLLQEGDK